MIILGKKAEVAAILGAAALWVPGVIDYHFLSDDYAHVVTWGRIPFSQIWQWFYSEYTGFYRPLTALLWRLNFALWGMNATGYILVNLLLHTGCALLVRDIACRIIAGQERVGLWAALLFLFLPGHIFGVLMIASLTGLLCTLLYLVAIRFYLLGRSGREGYRLISLGFFASSLLTKELAVSLPLLISAWEFLLQRRETGIVGQRLLRVCLPYWGIFGGYLGLRYFLFGHLSHSPLLHNNTNLVNLLVNGGRYIAALCAPWGLESFKPFFRSYPLLLIGAAVGICGVVAVAVWRFRGRWAVWHLLLLCWMGITTLPVLRLYSPWNTYLPSAGSALLFAGLIGGYFQRRTQVAVSRETIAIGALVVLFACYSILHQRQWRDAGDLCDRVLKAAERVVEERTGQFYLANLPTELEEAPVFGGSWGLTSGMQLLGHSGRIEPLVWVRKNGTEERTYAEIVDEQRFELWLEDPDEFFRLEAPEVLTHQLRPEAGYSYNKGSIRVTVKALNSQNEPRRLEIDMGNRERLQRVLLWNGQVFVPLYDG